MTRDELDEMVADLERGGVRIIRTDPQPYPNEDKWQIYCWSDHANCSYWITGVKLFREAVHKGLTAMLPKGTLDAPKLKAQGA